jgi:hypothetical protein
VFNPYLRPQGTVIPTLFVGLGGVGSRIVDRIANRATRLPNWEQQLRDLTSFFVIDTNINDQNELSSDVPRGNRELIGAVDKREVVRAFRASQDVRVLEWLDPNYDPREGLNPGAGQIRIESRLGFHIASASIRQKLDSVIRRMLAPNNTWRVATPPLNFYVYVYCTISGGTGSGCFLPFAYLIKSIIESFQWQPRVIGNFLLSTTVTKDVKPELHPDIHANTYAALKELEKLTRFNYQSVRQEYPDGMEYSYWSDPNDRTHTPRVRTSPYFLSFLVDQPKQMAIDRMERAVADCSFLQVFTPLISEVAGALDNYAKRNFDLTRSPGEYKTVAGGYAKEYGAFGTAAILLPATDLEHYCGLRFAAAALRRQITFNFSDSRQDLAGLLERFRIDYNDRAFASLDETARYKRINAAFVDSVQELARQDEREGQIEAYWHVLAESTDEGLLTGSLDDKGNPVRTMSNMNRVLLELDKARKDALRQVSIKTDAFIFHRDTVNTYTEVVSKLKERIRESEIRVEEKKKGLKTSADEGEVLTALALDPMQERYLSLRLLDLLDTKLIPEAEKQYEKERARTIATPQVKAKLETEQLEALRNAASAKKLGIRPDDELFYSVRDEAERVYKGVITSQENYFDADVRLTQFRALRDYLAARAKLYARLSLRMNSLVSEIEEDAAGLERGREGGASQRFTLCVEALETLTEPRRRLWREAFDALFIENGQEYVTFDRQKLARLISEQLAPAPDRNGRFMPKSDDRIAADLRISLAEMGQGIARAAIFGSGDRQPLTLEAALELEARIELGGQPDEDAVHTYIENKIQAVQQLAGWMARANLDAGQALDDNVTPYKARSIVFSPAHTSSWLRSRLMRLLEFEGVQPGEAARQEASYPDPHSVLVHDAVAGIPLYYFSPVVGELENAYEMVANDPQRRYLLHTVARWEHSLPTLNPRKIELTVDWSFHMLADGMLARRISFRQLTAGPIVWCWRVAENDYEQLGETLAKALYRLGTIYKDDQLRTLRDGWVRSVQETFAAAKGDSLITRARELRQWCADIVSGIQRKRLNAKLTEADRLDEPIYACLDRLLASREAEFALPSASAAAATEGAAFPE